MKKMNKELVAAVALVVACGGVANADTWNGAGDGVSFGDALNWDPSTNAFPGSTRDIDSAATVTRGVDIKVDRTFISGGGTLNVTGGTQSDTRSGNTIRNFVGRGSEGSVNMSGGSWNIGHNLAIGSGGANGNGTVAITGGDLNISRGANSANGTGGSRSIDVGDVNAGGGDGLLEISGGSLITRFGTAVGGAGTFSVLGSGASSISIGNNANGDGDWLQFDGSTLKFAIDGGGVTKIFVDDLTDDGVSVDFQAGSFLDLSFDGVVVPYDGTFTLMEAENTTLSLGGLGLSGATESGWSFDVDNSGANGLLTGTYTAIPEPGTLGLVAVFGGSVLFIRRRFRR